MAEDPERGRANLRHYGTTEQILFQQPVKQFVDKIKTSISRRWGMNKLSKLFSLMIRFKWILLISIPAILALLFLFNLSFSVTGAKYAEEILITAKSQSGLESTETRLSSIRVFRLSLNDNDVAVEKQSNGWQIHQKYVKKVRLDIPKELLINDLLITLKIGSKTFNVTGEEIQHTWT